MIIFFVQKKRNDRAQFEKAKNSRKTNQRPHNNSIQTNGFGDRLISEKSRKQIQHSILANGIHRKSRTDDRSWWDLFQSEAHDQRTICFQLILLNPRLASIVDSQTMLQNFIHAKHPTHDSNSKRHSFHKETHCLRKQNHRGHRLEIVQTASKRTQCDLAQSTLLHIIPSSSGITRELHSKFQQIHDHQAKSSLKMLHRFDERDDKRKRLHEQSEKSPCALHSC